MNYHSTIFSKYLGDEQICHIVSDKALINKILQFETALARSQGRLAIIPKKFADEICKVLSQLKIEPADLIEGTLQNGIPVITLLSLTKEKLTAEAKEHLHYGATSQDAMDTAQVLMIQDSIVVLEEKVNTLIKNLLNYPNYMAKHPAWHIPAVSRLFPLHLV